MPRTTLLATAAALAGLLSVSAMAAQAQGATSRIVVLKNVTDDQGSAVLSASDRLVWARDLGILVADVPEANVPALPPSLASSPEASLCGGPGAFQTALDAALPGYKTEKTSTGRYLIKEPVTLVRPGGAPLRPERRMEGRVPEDTCLSEGFETTPIWYEDGGNWWHYQGGQPNNAVGDYYWLDTNCDAHTGSWDCEAIMGGTRGATLPCGSEYDYNTDSWLEFAPWLTCLSGAPGAYLNFYGKVDSQTGLDYFYYVVSVDGTNYTGYRISGSLYDTWYLYSQNMRAWTGLGDLTTYPRFALAFVFQSGQNIPPAFTGYGVHLDDIALTATSISVIQVNKMGNPFRLAVTGGGFLPGAWVYIDGAQVPAVAYKGSSRLVAKGGAALKAMVPLGVPVCVTVVNPNGGTTPCYTYIR